MTPADRRRRRSGTAIVLGVALLSPLVWAMTSPANAADDPPKITGTWTWKWKDGNGDTHKHTLDIEGEGDKMVARERFDDQPAVKASKIKVDGKKVTVVVERKDRRSAYTGTITNGETISGTVIVTDEGQQGNEYGWTATRAAGGKP